MTMSRTYLEVIGAGFPLVQCSCAGDGSVYENLVWEAGAPLPDKATLEQWDAANPAISNKSVTKYQFRKLFTVAERIALDNYATNASLSDQNKATLNTIMTDLSESGVVELDNPDVINGVNFIASIRLITSDRPARILANLPPL
jgi:hypothetical protein